MLAEFISALGSGATGFFIEFLERLIYTIPIVIAALTVHELAHAFISYKLGDPTAQNEGRLTLNPLKHIDPLGFVAICIFGFGWAKPVPVRLQWFSHPKRDFALTALAGPLSNLLLALVGVPFLGLALCFAAKDGANGVTEFFLRFTFSWVTLNVGLCVFNLIPLPPLDGSRVIMAFLPNRIYSRVLQYERYGMLVIFLLILTGLLDAPLNWLITAVANPFLWLASALGGLFCGIPAGSSFAEFGTVLFQIFFGA